jgi:hypothetical protein
MAVGPVGNAIFVNQMTANVSSVANSHNNRVDFQNMVAQAACKKKMKKSWRYAQLKKMPR